MDLFDFSYPQQDFVNAMKATGLPLDGTSMIPWAGGSYGIMDKTGNMTGYAFDNQMGGYDITDTATNVKASTIENEKGGSNIFDDNYQQVGVSDPNVFGGSNLYDTDQQLDMFSQPNLFGGEDFYSNDMELLGVSQALPGQLNLQGIGHANFQVPDVTSLSGLSPDFTINENLFSGELSTNIFDILDIL